MKNLIFNVLVDYLIQLFYTFFELEILTTISKKNITSHLILRRRNFF